MHKRCLLTIFILYSCTAAFVIVAGQSTTDDNEDDNSLYTVVDRLIRSVATLQAELAELKQEARQPSVMLDNRKYCFPSNCATSCMNSKLHFHILNYVSELRSFS